MSFRLPEGTKKVVTTRTRTGYRLFLWLQWGCEKLKLFGQIWSDVTFLIFLDFLKGLLFFDVSESLTGIPTHAIDRFGTFLSSSGDPRRG